MPVMGAQVQQISVNARMHLLREAGDRRMEAMVETDLDKPAARAPVARSR